VTDDDYLPPIEFTALMPLWFRLLGLSDGYAFHYHGLQITAVTDLGIVTAAAVSRDRYIADLTLWKDVRDIELRIEAPHQYDPEHTTFRLTIQIPRVAITGSEEEVGRFCRLLVQVASGKPPSDEERSKRKPEPDTAGPA
jgi:hypothetical protein